MAPGTLRSAGDREGMPPNQVLLPVDKRGAIKVYYTGGIRYETSACPRIYGPRAGKHNGQVR